MTTFQLLIVAYNRIIYNSRAVYCGVTTRDGSLGLEARHEPVLCVLKENSLISYTDAAGAKNALRVDSGLLSFKNNECTLAVAVAD